MSPPPTLTVALLAYDEVESLESTVTELLDALRASGVPAELLVVDDGSTDGTGALADRLAAEHAEARVVHHSTNLGLGGGYRTGFREARGEFLSFFPADGQFPASILADFLPRMASADLVLGYLPERRPSLLGRALSVAERLLYRILVGPMPRFQGVFMLRRSILEGLPLRSEGRGWGVCMELVLRVARGPHRVVSVPTPIRPRRSGASKVQNLATIVSNVRQVVALRRVLRSAPLTAVALGGLVLAAGGCGPWPGPVAPPRTISVEVPVTAGAIGERAARFTLGAPLQGEVTFDLPRCEWAGSGAMRVDRACVGTFVLRGPRGTLRGGARALWSGYRQLLSLYGAGRVGTGCFAGVTSGEVVRDGPVSFPRLPLRVTLTVAGHSSCLPGGMPPDPGTLVRAARAADPDASEVALAALAAALMAESEEVRAAAAVALGFAASDAVHALFRRALSGTPALLAQAERTRELRALGGGPPSLCDAGEPDDPELATICAAARRGFEAARSVLAGALAAGSRQARREAALHLVRLGGWRARPVLEPAVRRAVASGDQAAAIDLAEALLLAPAR
ncbi:MAG: glycosyltransferase family 2 protein [Deltaproteobacteria bacterium]|nr:glycosyltransferase family 2 protein [Deltaproteobacteria bacterium]